jgi:hypothetical protein
MARTARRSNSKAVIAVFSFPVVGNRWSSSGCLANGPSGILVGTVPKTPSCRVALVAMSASGSAPRRREPSDGARTVVGVCRLIANHLHLAVFRSLRRRYSASTLIRPCPTPAMAVAFRNVETATLATGGSPPITRTTFPTCRAHYPGGSSGCACRLLPRSCSLPQNGRRVGIRIVTFEACSGFTRVAARRIAHPPKATFVARLRPGQLPDQAARQLPDLSTTIRVRPSLTVPGLPAVVNVTETSGL